jgi:hypothetical protein
MSTLEHYSRHRLGELKIVTTLYPSGQERMRAS